jgi:CcmD family protein
MDRVVRIRVLAVLLVMIWLGPLGLVAAQQPAAPTPAQEGFVPFDQRQAQEQLPAAPLVLAAYAVAWIVVFAYVWSIWRRLARVEHEMVEVSRRLAGKVGGGRP